MNYRPSGLVQSHVNPFSVSEIRPLPRCAGRSHRPHPFLLGRSYDPTPSPGSGPLPFRFPSPAISSARPLHSRLTADAPPLSSLFFPTSLLSFHSTTPSSPFSLLMADLTPSSRQVPIREDCWSEDATSTLVDAWGRRFLELNRGNLRQKDWQDVADSVNSLHGLTKKTHRTDVQCKNRIDTVKKKYKTERARVSASHGNFVSSWPFYARLDELIGPTVSMKKPTSPPLALPLPFRNTPPPAAAPPPALAIVAVSQKRPASAMDDGYFRRNYSAMAAAAAADALTEEEEEEDEEEEERVSDDEEAEGEGMSRLARAIKKFGEVYERVEAEKVRQMVELEKQRMQFAKDLEVQRMHMFMETQVQLERIKRGKKSTPSDI